MSLPIKIPLKAVPTPPAPKLPPRLPPVAAKVVTAKKVAAGKELPGQHITTFTIPGYHPPTSLEKPGVPGRLIIGLDPSLTNFGYVEVTESLEIVRHDTISTKKLDGMARLDFLINEVVVNRILGRKALWAEGIVVFREDYAFAAASSSDTILKELGGILKYVLHQKGIPLHVLPIASIKKFVTGKGNSQKAEMLKSVYKNFGYDAKDEHEADAFGVAALGVASLHPDSVKGLNADQKAALAGLARDTE